MITLGFCPSPIRCVASREISGFPAPYDLSQSGFILRSSTNFTSLSKHLRLLSCTRPSARLYKHLVSTLDPDPANNAIQGFKKIGDRYRNSRGDKGGRGNNGRPWWKTQWEDDVPTIIGSLGWVKFVRLGDSYISFNSGNEQNQT